jgi:hypothetical protein
MTREFKYLWPTKIRKFGISDPFFKLLVAKYEREIPWQTEVRDEATLNAKNVTRGCLRTHRQYPAHK